MGMIGLGSGSVTGERVLRYEWVWSDGVAIGADSRIRTDDLIITNDLLYQLSYIGVLRMAPYLAVAATLRFQNAMAKRFFRILNLPIHST